MAITHQVNANQNQMRYHITPTRMAIIKKIENNKPWQGCGETRTLMHRWWECKMVQSLWETAWQFLKKLNIELPKDQQPRPKYVAKRI